MLARRSVVYNWIVLSSRHAYHNFTRGGWGHYIILLQTCCQMSVRFMEYTRCPWLLIPCFVNGPCIMTGRAPFSQDSRTPSHINPSSRNVEAGGSKLFAMFAGISEHGVCSSELAFLT